MYLTRDVYGTLELWAEKPIRMEGTGSWSFDHYEKNQYLLKTMNLDSSLFPEITWEDEPVEIELSLKK